MHKRGSHIIRENRRFDTTLLMISWQTNGTKFAPLNSISVKPSAKIIIIPNSFLLVLLSS